MSDPEHPTGLTPCLAQRNGRSQEAGGKADGGDRSVNGKRPIEYSDPVRNMWVWGGAALPTVTASRHIPTILFSLQPPSDQPDRHCTAPAPILFSEAAASKHRPRNPTLNLERCMWQCRYDYSTFVVAINRLTRGLSLYR